MDDEEIRVVTSKQKTGMHETLQKSFSKPLYTTPQPAQKPYEILAMQVRPSEFAELIKGKEAVTGIPAYWAEWPNKENT
jgi:hypothetical protein